jgi:hypothetical protein
LSSAKWEREKTTEKGLIDPELAKSLSPEEIERRKGEPLEGDLKEGMNEAATAEFNGEETDFSKSVDRAKYVMEREVWQHEENLRALNRERLTLQEGLRSLEAQEYTLYQGLLKDENAPRDEFWGVRKDIKIRREKLAKVEGEMTERQSLIDSLRREMDFSPLEEEWFNKKEIAKAELEAKKRTLQEELRGSSQLITDKMAARDQLILERNASERKGEEKEKRWSLSLWVDKVKKVLREIGTVRNLDNEIARMNAEIEASLRKAEGLVEGIKALDALLQKGEKARIGSFGAERLAEYRRVKEAQEQTMEELAIEMGVVLGGEEEAVVEEVEEEPMRRAA